MLDADLSPYSVGFINQLRPQDPLKVVVADPPLPWKYGVTSDLGIWTKNLLDAWHRGEKLAVAMTSRHGAAAWAERLQDARPGAKIALINRDTAADEKYDLSNIDSWVGDYDALIYTPSIGTGVSIDIKDHFDRIFGSFNSETLPAPGCGQMLHRIRAPRCREILVYLRAGGRTRPGTLRSSAGRC